MRRLWPLLAVIVVLLGQARSVAAQEIPACADDPHPPEGRCWVPTTPSATAATVDPFGNSIATPDPELYRSGRRMVIAGSVFAGLSLASWTVAVLGGAGVGIFGGGWQIIGLFPGIAFGLAEGAVGAPLLAVGASRMGRSHVRSLSWAPFVAPLRGEGGLVGVGLRF